MGFIKAYVKSMRPYTFFITGVAGLLGMLLVQSSVSFFQKIAVLIILFLSYGINQVINDFLGKKEDKINAPHRPLVSGELDKTNAVIVTLVIFLLGVVVTFFFNPYALVIYFLGYLANVIYEYVKGIALLGNFWFGGLIALAPLYGALAITDMTLFEVFKNVNLLYISLLILLASSTMCYFTYFKDYKGDKKAKKETIIVLLSPKGARDLNVLMSLLPFVVLFFIFVFGLWSLELNNYFLILILITFIISQYTCSLFYSYREKKNSLELNFETLVLFQISLMALVKPFWALGLFLVSLLIMKVIFTTMYEKRLY